MIEVKIPQEIGQYEVKMVGPFTFRQAICAVSIGVIAYAFYNLLSPFVPRMILFGLIFILAIPFGCIGWVKPYGMHFEKFIFGWLFNNLISSAKRVFQSGDVISDMEKNAEIADKNAKKKKSKNVDTDKVLIKAQKKYRKYTYA